MDTFIDGLMNNPANAWFVIGFTLLAIEILAFGLGTGVLLFGSIGALITGALLWFGVLENSWVYSIACFAIASALTTLALWVPFKKLQSGAELGKDRSSDLIGHQFRIDSDLTRMIEGKCRYSGNDWRVCISEESINDSISRGVLVRVVSVDPGVFHVVPD